MEEVAGEAYLGWRRLLEDRLLEGALPEKDQNLVVERWEAVRHSQQRHLTDKEH